jgi:hypothetical protein
MSITIRKAEKDDIPDIARIHLPAKQKAYADAVDNDYLQSMTAQEFEDTWTRYMEASDATQYIADYGEQAVGVISYGRLRTPPPGTSKIRPLYAAEIFGIHVHPDYWKKGIGKSLIQKACEDLMSQNLKSLCLWVIQGNKNAIGFYDYLNGQRIGKRMIEVGPSKVKELCYGWRDIKEILEK